MDDNLVKRWLKRLWSALVIASVFNLVFQLVAFAYTPVKFEYVSTGAGDTSIHCYGVNWYAQTFTASNSYHDYSVIIDLLRSGAGNYTFTVSLRLVDVNGKPTGADLITKSMTSVPTSWTWQEFVHTVGYDFTSGVKYCWVCRYTAGNSTNYVAWYKRSANPYSGGTGVSSTDSGVTWTVQSGYDLDFENWGYFVDPPTGVTGFSVARNSDKSISANWTQSATSAGVRFVVGYLGIYPVDYNSPNLIYSGTANTYTSIPLPYYVPLSFRIWEWNSAGWSGYSEQYIGGEDLNVNVTGTLDLSGVIDLFSSLPWSLLSFVTALILLAINVKLKSGLVGFACILFMAGPLFDVAYKDTWFQSGVAVLILAAIAINIILVQNERNSY